MILLLKKFNLILFCTLFLTLTAIAQTTDIEWQKSYGGFSGEGAHSIIQTAEGGYAAVGFSREVDGDVTGNNGGYDYWVIKTDHFGNLQWQHSFGGTGLEEGYSIIQTTDHGYAAVGVSNSNDGDVTGNHGNYDLWVIKLDSTGALQWQKSLGGSSQEQFGSIKQTLNGGYIIEGSTFSNNGDVNNLIGLEDIWIVHLDPSGNIVWEKTYGGTSSDYSGTISLTNDGGYVFTGTTASSDINVSFNNGFVDIWMVKIDSIGTLQWEKSYGGTDAEEPSDITTTTDGGYIIAGVTESWDGDITNFYGMYDYWILKLDLNGNLTWQKSLGGFDMDVCSSVKETADGGFLVFGSSYSQDGDVTGIYGYNDYWVTKLDLIGNLQWQQNFGGTNQDEARCMVLTADSGFVMTGYSASNDIDVSGNHGYADIWIAKVGTNFNIVKGNAFVDQNTNQLKDPGEPTIANHRIYDAASGMSTYSNANGDYNLSVINTGTFTIQPEFLPYYNPLPANHTVVFNSNHSVDSLNDFAFQSTGTYNDLRITLTPLTFFRPGFNVQYRIDYKNVGTTTISGTVKLFPDLNLTYVSATTAPASVSNDSVLWSFNNLLPLQSGSITITLNLSGTASNGTVINTSAVIESILNEANIRNNFAEWQSIVQGSYDPNLILVDKSAIYDTSLVQPPYLDYIIYFQNTGTDTAFTIKVANNINEKLDLASFEVLSSSHPYEINYVSSSRLMNFQFNNILLPDSNIDEAGSHGFIHYQIKPNQNLQVGDTILNKAAIFFDFNSPINTNVATTAIIQVTGIFENKKEANKILISPNPSSDFINVKLTGEENFDRLKIYSISGMELINTKLSQNTRKTNSNIQSLTSGIYIIELSNNKNRFRSKFVKQ